MTIVKEPLVLVLGNEAHGVSQEAMNLADYLVKIDIANIDSLNVSVAAGIMMHYFK
jgi:TrmH family RNA methyltransferase